MCVAALGAADQLRFVEWPAHHRRSYTAFAVRVPEQKTRVPIVVSEFISLDGVVQAPGGPDEDRDGGFEHGGWTHPFFEPEVVGGAFSDALAGAEALLFGRRTWSTMAAAWPERAGDPFADRMNSIPKYVVSATLRDDELTWSNTMLIPGGDAMPRIRELQESVLVMGSPTLVRALFREELVDELRLIVMPVLLGGGKSIFPDDGALHTLELVSAVTSGAGVQVCAYRKARRP